MATMTQSPRSHLAVVPAYNEAATVGEVVRSLREHAPGFDVLVVDDGSTDGTAERGRATPAPRVVRHPFNLGIGGAVQSGFTYALEHGYDVHGPGRRRRPARPAEIAQAARRPMDEDPRVDLVCGSRFLTDDSGYPAPISRRTGIHIFAFLLSRIVGQRVSDPTSGFRLYNRRGIALFARDYPHDYPEVEAVLMVHFHRLRMREVPVRMFAARRRRLVDQLGQVGLLHGQGAAGDLRRASRARRPVVEPGRRRAGGGDARDLMELADPAGRDRRHARRCSWSCSSWCAGAGCSSATRSLWLVQRARAARAGASGSGLLDDDRERDRGRLPARTRCS